MDDSKDPIGYLIKRTQQALRSSMDKALASLDLTPAQYAAMSELAKERGLSNAEVARRCFVTPQTMHQILVGLERERLIERSQHPSHGRIQQLTLAPRGEALLKEAHKLVQRIEARMTHGLTAADVKRLEGLLEHCHSALERMNESTEADVGAV